MPIRSSWTTLREYRSALQMLDNDDVSLTESITDRLLEISEEGRGDEFEEGLLEISEEGRDDELTDRSPESFEGGMDDELPGEKGK